MENSGRTLMQKLGLLGIVSFLSYAAAVVFAATGFNAALGIHLFCKKRIEFSQRRMNHNE